MRLLIAFAAEQQVRLAAGLRDVAVTGAIVAVVLVALEQVLAQATDRLRVDPRIVRLLLTAVPAKEPDRLIIIINSNNCIRGRSVILQN